MKSVWKQLLSLVLAAAVFCGCSNWMVEEHAAATSELFNRPSQFYDTDWTLYSYTDIPIFYHLNADGTADGSRPDGWALPSFESTWSYKDGVLTLDGIDYAEDKSDKFVSEPIPYKNGTTRFDLYPNGWSFAEKQTQHADLTVCVNGQAVQWTDAVPFIDSNDRTMVPLRPIADAMGLNVAWDSSTGTATFAKTVLPQEIDFVPHPISVAFKIGSETITIDGVLGGLSYTLPVEMDTAPVIRNDRTFAPVRYLAEMLGYSVGWDDSSSTVTITGSDGYADVADDSIFAKEQERDTWNTLDDGEHLVTIYPDGAKTLDGKTYETVCLLAFEDFDDADIRTIRVGNVIHLHDFSFSVESIDYIGDNEIWFNDGSERCQYISSENIWRFGSPSDVPYTYIADVYTLPINDSVDVFDRRTPVNYGRTVYGETYNPEVRHEDEFYRLNTLSDYFAFHSDFSSEQVYITVKNGAIQKISIPYRP